MAEKKGPEPRDTQSIAIDLSRLYSFSQEDVDLEITSTSYSNMAFIQVTHRDVFIDFLEMPGIRSGDRVAVPGTRIFMSFAAAQRLSEALTGVLEKVHREGGMEEYVPGGTKKGTGSKAGRGKNDKEV